MTFIQDFRKARPFFFASHALFCLIEAFLYGLVLAGRGGNRLQYATIVLSFLFASLYTSKDGRSVLTVGALAFTLVADFCLVLLPSPKRIEAMQAFSFVQLLYFVRILLEIRENKKCTFHLAARIIFLLLAEGIACALLREKADHLSLLSVFYFANLIGNLILSLWKIKRFPLLALGLFFFLCCDTFVGLSVGVGTYLELSADHVLYKLAFSHFNLVWAFYIPAQALLAMSAAALFSPYFPQEKGLLSQEAAQGVSPLDISPRKVP